ncbi:MAG: DUF4350 domain-containing protein [Gaiellaceae bacterium]
MSRRWRIAVGAVALLVAVDLALRFIGTLTGGTPGGPRSSSYATSPHGDAAYAELLGHAGHPADQVRKLPHEAPPSARATVFLLDPPAVGTKDLEALRGFVREGGRLVAAGLSREAMRGLVSSVPQRAAGSRRIRAQGFELRTDGLATWRPQGFLAIERVGGGSVYLLADSSPLQNRLLGAADNAALGLALAGPGERPVEFLESYHGYGTGSGLAALPLAWKLLLGGLGLAALVYAVARGRRFGPPEEEGRSLPPPRREYVDSLAAVIARSRRRDAAVGPVRREARDALLRRAALPPDAGDDAVRSAARRLGLGDEEAEALLRPARTDADVLAVGRAAARIRQDHR